jgi:desulfoferrodoxin-like iron-binding protein
MANQLGKMYECGKCGARVIVTKAGGGTIKCCGAPMQQK